MNTGDFILFRSYSNDNICFIIGIKIILPLIQQNYFTHIGMIYKASNRKIYILESTTNSNYCHINNKLVNSQVMIVDFNERINKATSYRIHIVKTNIYQHININNLKNSIEKYKNYTFNDINCIEYITRLLYDSNKLLIGLLNRYSFNDILDKTNYNFDVRFDKPIIIKDY